MYLRRTILHTILGALAGTMLAAPAFAADPVFPLNSRVGLVPPAGFTASKRFQGFENAQISAAIILSELPGDAYGELVKGFTNEALKARGMTVEVREPVTLKDGKGFFVSGPQESGGIKRHEAVMIANAGGITSVVSFQMVDTARTALTDAVIRDTFKSVAIRKDVPEAERIAVLPYKLGNTAGFRIIRSSLDGTVIMTDGPLDQVAAAEQPFVLITVSSGDVPQPDDRDKFARRLFAGAPGMKDVKITRAETLRLGTSPGHEIVAEAKDISGVADVNAVQWIKFGPSGQLQMFGIFRKANWNEVFPKLRAIRDGIEPRNPGPN
jgi:hypothetical protein